MIGRPTTRKHIYGMVLDQNLVYNSTIKAPKGRETKMPFFEVSLSKNAKEEIILFRVDFIDELFKYYF